METLQGVMSNRCEVRLGQRLSGCGADMTNVKGAVESRRRHESKDDCMFALLPGVTVQSLTWLFSKQNSSKTGLLKELC